MFEFKQFPLHFVGHRLPREIADGVYWCGDCMLMDFVELPELEHAYLSVFVVVGKKGSILVDTGHPKDWVVLRDQVDSLIAQGVQAPRWIFPTHPEVAHCGNIGRLLEHYPGSRAVGDLRDLHIVFPEFEDRFDYKKAGDSLDLGGRTFRFVEPILWDLVPSLWGYVPEEKILFSADGMNFDHYHNKNECGLLAEEIPDLPIERLVTRYLNGSMFWARHLELQPFITKILDFVRENPTKIIAPSHGAVLTDIEATLPKVLKGLAQEHVVKLK